MAPRGQRACLVQLCSGPLGERLRRIDAGSSRRSRRRHITCRGARTALTYAQLDGADRIEIVHLEAALAFVRFAGDCAAYLFGGMELDPISQKILEALATGPKTQTEISGLFGRHLPKDQLNGVLSDLQERGRITLTLKKTSGAPLNKSGAWYDEQQAKISELRELSCLSWGYRAK